jgi:single-stranded-DNA-specific exonuclease
VASRLKELYKKPCIVIAFDPHGVGKGSGRSISSIHLGNLMLQALDQRILEHGGGHRMAAGLTIKKENLSRFRHLLESHMASRTQTIEPSLELDGSISLSALSANFFEHLGRLEPFGVGHSSPRLMFGPVTIAWRKIVGADHVQCLFEDVSGCRVKGMAFRARNQPLGDYLMKQRKPIYVAGSVHLQEWKQKQSPCIYIDDVLEI